MKIDLSLMLLVAGGVGVLWNQKVAWGIVGLYGLLLMLGRV